MVDVPNVQVERLLVIHVQILKWNLENMVLVQNCQYFVCNVNDVTIVDSFKILCSVHR
jgi:hypothetical protein